MLERVLEKIKNIPQSLKIVVTDLFVVLLFIYIFLVILERLIEGFVSKYFDLNNLIIFIILFGVMHIILEYKKEQE